MRPYARLLRKRKIIRYSCLVFGIIIISCTAYKLTNNTHRLVHHVNLPEIDNNLKEFSVRVNQPIFEGFNNSNQAYKIMAHNIAKTSDIYFLEEVEGEYYLSQNEKITFFSKYGNFNDQTKDLHLNDHVRIIYGATEFFGYDININVRDKSFHTQNSVKIFHQGSSIEANSLNIKPKSQIIELQGAVKVTINLKTS